MGITVEFKDFMEMVEFAQALLKGHQSEPMKEKQNTAPTYQQPVQSTPNQQTASNTAPINPPNVPAAPVQQTAPQYQSAVQQTAPTYQAPTQQPAATYQASVQTTPQSYTRDDLAKAAMTLMDAGRQPELLNLLVQFGVDSLPAIPEAQYGAFATALRGLGAQI